MGKYVVVVEGVNIRFKHKPNERVGLYTTRRVESRDIAEAEQLAIELVKEELALTVGIANLPDDPPVFSIDESYEVSSFRGSLVPGKGFSIYEMD